MINSDHLSGSGKSPEPPSNQRVELMDVRGLADFLHLDRQTIYNWLHQHKLSGIKVGGVWRFDRRVVEEWLQAQTVEGHGNTAQRQRHNDGSLPPKGLSRG